MTVPRFVLTATAVLLSSAATLQVRAAVPPVPKISGPIAGPGVMYPNPPVSAVATAAKVEDSPYVTEEFFVSGAINEVPYTTRIIVRPLFHSRFELRPDGE